MRENILRTKVLYTDFTDFEELDNFIKENGGKMVQVKTIDGRTPQILGREFCTMHPSDFSIFAGSEIYDKDSIHDFIEDNIIPWIEDGGDAEGRKWFLEKYNKVLNEIATLDRGGYVAVGGNFDIETFPNFGIRWRYDNYKMELGVLVEVNNE